MSGPAAPPPEAGGTPLLEASGVKKRFKVPAGPGGRKVSLRAVDGVDVVIRRGETLGLVGESGCGKSTLGRILLGLMRPTEGSVLYQGADLFADGRSRQRLAGEIQIIFQDPYSSLNPRMSVGAILAEPFLIHRRQKGAELDAALDRLLARVGLRPEDRWRYPHEFSGGQRQRIGIARALALDPRIIIADEPVSSLDVSIQAQILNLLMDLRQESGLSYLFISHDLAVIRHISDRVAVMYLGRMVEEAPVRALFEAPLHPYTEALLAAIPRIGRTPGERKIVLKGDIPSPVNPPPGCHFHPRCPIRGEGCDRHYPKYRRAGPGRFVACHYRGIGAVPPSALPDEESRD